MITPDLFSRPAPAPAPVPAPRVTTVRSIEEQTGWHRPGPVASCQDLDVLTAVHEFDYDLGDRSFVRYFEGRTGLMISLSAPGVTCTPEQWADRANGPLNWRVLLAAVPRPRYLQDWSDPRTGRCGFANQEVPDDEFKSWQGVWAIQRGKLQDCWELYQSQNQQKEAA